jgi:protein involved in polysaccharide export with SLBB domain
MNRIVIDMEKIFKSKGKQGDIIMHKDDYVYIPEIPSGISVMGAVGANGTIKFESQKRVKYYIQRAGNFTTQADKKRTRLIKADGRVFAGNGTLRQKVEVGDAIVVPTEIKKDHDWLKTLSSVVSIVGGIATTALIIDRL